MLSTLYNYPSQFEYVSGETPMTHWMYPAVIGAIYMTTILALRAIMNKVSHRIEARWLAAVHNWNMFAISVLCFFGITYGTFKLAFVRPFNIPISLLSVALCLYKNLFTNQSHVNFTIWRHVPFSNSLVST